ncbi:MAG TPA: GAF domain-containing protein [Terriglobales bacterium]
MHTTATNLADPSRERMSPRSNRRRYVRHKVHTPAYAALNNSFGDSPAIELQEILNISEEGLAIQLATPLDEPRVNLSLDLTGTGELIDIKGRIVWQDFGRAGVRFSELPAHSRQKLKEWLFANALIAYENHAAGSQAAAEASSALDLPTVSFDLKTDSTASFPADFTATLVALEAIRREVAAAPTADLALQLISDRALAITRSTGAAIAVSDQNDLVCRASCGSDAPPIGVRFKSGEGFSGECIRFRQTLRCDDSETDPRVDKAICRALGVRSMLATPISAADSILGLIEVFSPLPNSFHTQDGSALERLAKLAADRILPPEIAEPEIVESEPFAKNSSAEPVASHKPTLQSAAPETSKAATDQVPETSATEATPADNPWAATATILSESPDHEPIRAPSEHSHSFVRILLLAVAAIVLIAAALWLFVPFKIATGRIPVHAEAQAAVQPAVHKPSPIVAPPDFKSLHQLAEKGDPAAQFAVGAHYATGEDVPQDYAEALRWFTKAAEQGHIGAQSTLGAYYWSGRGAPQDLSKAYFWAVLAQTGGDDASRYRVEFLASRMTHAQIVAAQQQADEWIRAHETTSSSSTQPK